MKIGPKEIEAVLALPAHRRFEYFVKKIVDREEVWALFKDGWALASTDDGVAVFPLWPAPEDAEHCIKGHWEGCQPRSISLADLTDELLPRLKDDDMLLGAFFAPTGQRFTVTVEDLTAAIEAEMQRY